MPNDKNNRLTSISIRYLFPILIIFIYAISRYLLFRAGVIFDCSTINENIQYLDINVLKENLLSSIFYQHTQPPLFNLFLGIIFKIFPTSYESVFSLFFHFCSLIIYFTMFRIFRLLKMNAWLALFISTVFILLPDAIMYENWLMYTWPSATLLILAGYSILRYEQDYNSKNAIYFIVYICLLCLTRSMFHLIYLLCCIIVVLLMRSTNRKAIAIASIFAILTIGSVYIKNYALFGFFGSSSWLGPSLMKMTTYCKISNFTANNLSPHDPYSVIFMYPSLLKKEIANSELTLVNSFSSIYMYPSRYRKVAKQYRKIPVLAYTNKPTGYNNLNYYGYLQISREQLTIAKCLIINDFKGYLKRVVEAWSIYMLPAWSYKYLGLENKKSIQKYIYWLTGSSDVTETSDLSLLINPIIFLFVLFVYGYNLIKYLKKSLLLENPIFYNFLIGTILYVAILGNGLEIGENNRFRVQTDGLMYIALFTSIKVMYKYYKRSKNNL